MKQRITFVSIVIVATYGLSFSALAIDGKTAPGAMCLPASENLDIARTTAGHMRNNSTTEQTWLCPIVREGMEEELDWGRVWYIDNGCGSFATAWTRVISAC